MGAAVAKGGYLHEALRWKALKKNQQNGLEFDRQKIIGNYIVDFYCAEKELAIEVDGGSHEDRGERDAFRDADLEALP